MTTRTTQLLTRLPSRRSYRQAQAPTYVTARPLGKDMHMVRFPSLTALCTTILLAGTLALAAGAAAEDIPVLPVSAGGGWEWPLVECPGEMSLSNYPEWVSGGASHHEIASATGGIVCALMSDVADDLPPPPADSINILALRFWGITNGAPHPNDALEFDITICVPLGKPSLWRTVNSIQPSS